jgi:hypothetical protein
MKAVVLSVLLALPQSWIFGQSLQLAQIDRWPLGTVVLRSGEEHHGRLQYDPTTEVVQLATPAVLKAYSVHQVQSFRFEDPRFGLLREFVPYRFTGNKARRRPIFLEVVVRGHLPVYRRTVSALQDQMVGAVAAQGDRLPDIDRTIDFTYYIEYEGQLRRLSQFRRKIFPKLCRQYGHSLSQLMHTYGLHIGRPVHQIRLINQYNYWVADPVQFAFPQ